MDISFDYRVTFQGNVTADRKYKLFFDATDDEFRLIVKGLVNGLAFAEIPGIDVVIRKLDEEVEYIERRLSINGIFRDVSLTDSRYITSTRTMDVDRFLSRVL